MNERIHVIGVGSPFGDDRLGWAAAEALQCSSLLREMEAGRVVISTLDRPGALLPMHWRNAGIVILLDAVRSGAAPGTRHRLDMRDLAGAGMPCSSHGFGVVSAIELARALGDLPARLLLRGIEADPLWTGFSLSVAVADALPFFVADVAKEMLDLASYHRPAATNTA